MISQPSVTRWGGATIAVAQRQALPSAAAPPGTAGRLRERTAGRLVAIHALAAALGRTPLPRIVATVGPPRLDTDESATSARLYLSISHSRRYAAAAVAPEHCGIDLCDLADADRVVRTARSMFTPAELDIGFLDDPWLAVTAWAIKEAAAKQAGTSIFGPTATSTDLAEIDPPRMTTGRRVTVFRLPGTALTLVLGPTSAAPPSLPPNSSRPPAAGSGRSPVDGAES